MSVILESQKGLQNLEWPCTGRIINQTFYLPHLLYVKYDPEDSLLFGVLYLPLFQRHSKMDGVKESETVSGYQGSLWWTYLSPLWYRSTETLLRSDTGHPDSLDIKRLTQSPLRRLKVSIGRKDYRLFGNVTKPVLSLHS